MDFAVGLAELAAFETVFFKLSVVFMAKKY